MNEQMKKRIGILLSNAVVNPVDDDFNYKSFTAGDIDRIANIKKEKVILKPEAWSMSNPHALVLIKLYRQLSSSEQLEMLELLKGHIVDNSDRLIKMVAVLVLVNTNNAKFLINTIIGSFNSYNQNGLAYSMMALMSVLKYQPHLFMEEDIDTLHDWIDSFLNGESEVGQRARGSSSLYDIFIQIFKRLREKTVIIISKSFTEQIETNFNPDINADEIKIKKFFEDMGFPKDMDEFLDHINDQINNGDTAFKFKNTMDSIRAFTERLLEVIAKSLDPSTKIDGKDSAAAAKFFKDKGLISTEMGELIVSLRHFLSNNGVHRLKSRREDARIAKNIVVEMSLYLVLRLKELNS